MLTSLALSTLLLAYPAPREPAPTDKGPGYLGITFEAAGDGVLVTDVRTDGPALAAGIKANDIILKFNGEPLEFDVFARKIVRMRPGTVVPVDILRGQDRIVIKVRLGVRPDDFPYALPDPELQVPMIEAPELPQP